MDREKVVKGLEHCTSHDDGRDKFGGVGKCVGCPYYGHDRDKFGCTGRLKEDALSLLKKQEAVEPIPPKDESDMWECGNCNHQLFRCTHQRYCEMCGQAVKWE